MCVSVCLCTTILAQQVLWATSPKAQKPETVWTTSRKRGTEIRIRTRVIRSERSSSYLTVFDARRGDDRESTVTPKCENNRRHTPTQTHAYRHTKILAGVRFFHVRYNSTRDLTQWTLLLRCRHFLVGRRTRQIRTCT